MLMLAAELRGPPLRLSSALACRSLLEQCQTCVANAGAHTVTQQGDTGVPSVPKEPQTAEGMDSARMPGQQGCSNCCHMPLGAPSPPHRFTLQSVADVAVSQRIRARQSLCFDLKSNRSSSTAPSPTATGRAAAVPWGHVLHGHTMPCGKDG